MTRGPVLTEALHRTRRRASSWLWWGALLLLHLAVAAFATLWLAAHRELAIPECSWGAWDGNHGPWRHRYALRGLWWLVLECQVLSFGLAGLSFVLAPNRRAGVTALGVLLLGLAFVYSQYWLVD